MEGLAVAIQRREVRFPDGVLKDELEAFEFQYNRTGVTYSAPEGMHDDCVCALALAWRKGSVPQPGAGVLGWMIEQVKARQAAPRKADPLPWRTRHDDPIVEGATIDLYAEARAKLGLEQGSVCAACGGRIGSSRVTDGVLAWHPQCAPR